MKRTFFIFLTMLMALPAMSQANDVQIDLTEAGQLELKVDLLEMTSIDRLTITGVMGAEDLRTLRSAQGKLATVQTLDISGVRLIPDETNYYAELYGGVGGDNAYKYYRYYISDFPHEEVEYDQTGLGAGVRITKCFNNNYSAVFNSTQAYKKIILPKLSSIGEDLVSNNNCVEEVIMQEGARYIGGGAFSGADALSSITVPSTVDSIGTNAFKEMNGEIILLSPVRSVAYGAFEKSSLKTFDFSALEEMGEYAFSETKLEGTADISKLSKVPAHSFEKTLINEAILSPELEEIGEYAFYATQLSRINLPVSSYKVGFRAFDETPWYQENNRPDSQGIIYIGTTAYALASGFSATEVSIKDGTTAIGDYLFSGLSGIQKISLPSTVRTIGKEAFRSQSELKNIEWPANLEKIEDRAFMDCSELSFGAFPEGLKSIGSDAFYRCYSILEITLPESLEEIGDRAFDDCNLISRVNLNSIRADFYHMYLEGLTHIVIGPKVEYVGNFSLNEKLRIVRFEERNPTTPLYIGNHAFSGCPNLIECHLPSSIESVDEYAFSSSPNVNFGTFPSEIKKIGQYAFYGIEEPFEVINLKADSIPEYAFASKGLTKITFATNPTHLGDGCLMGSSITTFHLPAALMNANEISYPFKSGIGLDTTCEKLTSVTFEEGAVKFNISLNGTAITDLVVPDGIKEFKSRAPLTLLTLSLPADCLELDKYILFTLFGKSNTVISWRIPDNYVFEGDPSEHVIGSNWFDGYANKSIILPEGYGGCDSQAFYDVSLEKLSFPATLQWIDEDAMRSSKIGELEFRGTTPPELRYAPLEGTFYSITVPFATKEAYSHIFKEQHRNLIREMPGNLVLTLDKDNLEFSSDEPATLSLDIQPAYAEISSYSWTSSNPQVATVDGYTTEATVYAAGPGECDITVTIGFRGEEYTQSAHVTVTDYSGIEDITIDSNEPVEIFNTCGTLIYSGHLSDASLMPGVYIVRQGSSIHKIGIK